MVSTNYRLRALGWLAVSDNTEAPPLGNFGLSDQIAALRWVCAQIEAFGNDPANVTIFGQSAGAYDVCALLVSPEADGLFERAIMQSGSCRAVDAATLIDPSKDRFTAVGCPRGGTEGLACAREADVAAMRGRANQALGVCVYGRRRPAPAPPAGQGPPTGGPPPPLSASCNADEINLLGLFNEALQTRRNSPRAELWRTVVNRVGDEASADLQAVYNADRFPKPPDALMQGTTDAIFACPTRLATMTGPAPGYSTALRSSGTRPSSCR